MGDCSSKSNAAIGFLTVVEHQEFGLFGGYLILNLVGRPLEFHCTTPVKPNRAQKILYGPTLEEFIYGEQIGKTLIEHGGTCPLAVCTDVEPVLAARQYVASPLVLVLSEEQHAASTSQVASISEVGQDGVAGKFYRLDAAHSGPQLVSFRLGRNRLAVPATAEADRCLFIERFSDWAEAFDLAEPFQRIRAAIEEAQQAAQ